MTITIHVMSLLVGMMFGVFIGILLADYYYNECADCVIDHFRRVME